MGNHYVYMIRCQDDSLYTGYTTDVTRRIQMHEEGKGAKYTRGKGPFLLEYFEEYATKQEAMQSEYAIKQLSKRAKEQLIQEGKLTNEATKKL
ncbi:GIY-YIG nuclease family protein [Alkalihalobacterium alkalinitrilicum]|uniref:GIY-YIG nuclease family protein n=1 Tax=Alkalihalobacterium alkalinitrilicum TaxID=427920 RepID=UPI000994E1E4|nr:GIY-YIG nuclease family protein [Alkalihalobacterium alkalinitrilicum]